MKKAFRVFLIFFAATALFSCFSITVNVYFPEKDVKSAFKSLEKELMKGGEEGVKPARPEGEKPPPAAPGPHGRLDFEFGPRSACAQGAGELSGELADRLKNDPDVVRAYAEMGERLGFINRLRDKGVLGEGNDGLLKARGEAGKKETVAMEEENSNRKTIIRSMAKAIVGINKQPVNEDTISQVLDKAAGQFAAVRSDAARPGWWVQKADGSWVRK